MRAPEKALLDTARRGEPIMPSDHVPTIDTEAELKSFRHGLIHRQALTADALGAIERRRVEIRAAKRQL